MYWIIAIIFTGSGVFAAQLPRSRIAGGEEAPAGLIPYQVYLEINGIHICGGAIVDPKIVITAAHCVEDVEKGTLGIVAGSLSRLSGGTSISVENFQQHPDFDPKTNDFDLAILFLKAGLTFGKNINKILLPNENEAIPEKSLALVSGWGITSKFSDEKTTNLHYVNVPIWEESECKKYFDPYKGEIICAGEKDGSKQSCRGDSGGPLAYRGKLIGVVSWGYGCGSKYPSFYTNVAFLRKWIKNTAHI